MLESGIRVGKYLVGKKLGEGGFGVLYTARDGDLDREVAIKFLRPEHAFKPSILQRFLQEARAAARIDHPGIVTVYESGIVAGTNTRADGTVYIAMELLAGETLAARLARAGKLPVPVAAGIARQLATALAAAHAAGIVHRDLKPQNVFLVPDSAVVGGERVKILDFGIAKLVDDFGSNMQTHSMQVLGTPMYMSPEQCRSSGRVDARSDVYALGCILFELVCARPPFDGDVGDLIGKHQHVAPPTARSLVADLPDSLDALVSAMLAKSPADRPQTMDAVLVALYPFAAPDAPNLAGGTHGGEQAEPLSVTLVSGAPARSRRLALYLGAAVAIGAGVAIALFVTHTSESGGVPAMTAIAAEIERECLDRLAVHDADEAQRCAFRLRAVDQPAYERLQNTMLADNLNLVRFERLQEALAHGDLVNAGVQLGKIDDNSPYKKRALDALAAHPPAPAAPQPAAPPQNTAACDAETWDEHARQDEAIGQHRQALLLFEAALTCKPTLRRYQLAFMSACNAGNAAKAKQFYPKLGGVNAMQLAQMCARNGISLKQLAAP